MGKTYAQTVSGKIVIDQLGITLSHEHLIVKPNNPDPMYEPYTLDDVEKSTEESILFRKSGGRTIVEMTPINYGRNPLLLKEISEKSSIHIICTTGFHEEQFLPEWVFTMSDEEIKELVLNEINEGIENTGVFPGVLKIGTTLHEITEMEKRLIRIISEVHLETGLPISTHTSKGTMAIEQAKLFLEHGVDPSRVILGHVDIPNNPQLLIELCKLGFNVQIDHVGRELEAADAEKIDLITTVIKEGFIEQLFISGDMGKKGYLHAYGGEPGLVYFLTQLKENLLKEITEEEFNHIFTKNPQRFFGRFKSTN